MAGPSFASERRLLQAAIALAGIVPVGAGLAGALLGLRFVGDAAGWSPADSHFRYLSGLLLGIGLAFWLAIPSIERAGERFRLLTAIIVLGGALRLVASLQLGFPGAPMTLALGMELVVTPLLCLWQARIARLAER